MKRELPGVQAGFRKGRGTRDQIANICWMIIEKAREFQRNIYFCFIDNDKAFDCVDHNKLWKILKEMGIPDHFTCFLRNLYANWLSEEALQIAEERSENQEGKGKVLNTEFQRITRRDKKAFFNEQCLKIEENNRREKTRDLLKKKLAISRAHFTQRWAQ